MGAQFTPLWGTETAGTEIPGGTYHYIKYTTGGVDYYLNSDGRFNTTKSTQWETDANNHIHSGNIYLTYSVSGGWGNRQRNLSTGRSNSSQLVSLNNNNGYIYYNDGNTTYYLQGTTNGDAPTMANSTQGRAQWTTETVEAQTMPGFSPGAYTLK